jgi:hypothetical protein
MKRRIALLTDGWKRLVNTAWSTGLVQYIKENNVDASVEWFQSWGGASQNSDFIHGEYNIYTLPDFAEYDGIVVELVNMVDQNARERILNRVRESGVPAVALCDDIPGMYYVSVRGYEAIREFMYHLYEKHGCRSFHFAGGPRNNYENGQRVMAYQTALRELGLPE